MECKHDVQSGEVRHIVSKIVNEVIIIIIKILMFFFFC